MKSKWILTAVLVALCGMAQAAFVTIGDAGNTSDTNGYGAVSYEYNISVHEVTIAEFEASGAGNGNENYWNDGTRTVGADAPAGYVSLYEAMRYCNYLTSGNVTNGVYTFNAGTGAYESTMSRSAIMAGGLDGVATDTSKIYALPTEDEWYKAAYYDASGAGGYSLYANGTGMEPTEGGGATGWNYHDANSLPNRTREAALGSEEQNGTVNMMGNVYEWMEDSAGVTRGGSYYTYAIELRSSTRGPYNPLNERSDLGFRVVEVVPEPAVEFVTIGNAGNTADTTGYGAVAYEYNISTHEVTIAEMAASGAGDGNEGYWNDGTRTVETNAPAVNVTLYEAMKYCNYLTSGNIYAGVYGFDNDVYVSTMSRVAIMAGGLDSVATDPGKIYALPTEDEWHKAAYYTGSGYSDYANGDDVVDGAPTEGGGASGWNYHYVNSSPNYMRDTALGTVEQNGTVNMMGNVWEWVEDSAGVFRGGGYNNDVSYLRSSYRWTSDPSNEFLSVGLRPIEIEVVPEPAAEFVMIGDAGNTNDTSGYGGVSYEYYISDHEVTIAEFQASGAGDGNEDYWNDGTRTVGTAAPASMVSLYEAMKYCNYLTSGDVHLGAYVFSAGVYQSTDRTSALATYGTIYAVPTEDEWYKAAYCTGSNYSPYANGTAAVPTEGGGATGWNYNNTTTRDATLGTIEQNGTLNMMGNVWEWVEESVVRGGSYGSNASNLRTSSRVVNDPSSESFAFGFRVVVAIGAAPAPTPGEIGIAGSSGTLTDGGSEAFGNQAVGVRKTQIFTISNDAVGAVTSLDDFRITKDGANAIDFSIGAIGTGSLGNGQSTTFRVTYTPPDTGSHTATVHIASNDLDESPFDITLTGTGLANSDTDPGSDDWETANGFSPSVDGDVLSLDSDGDGSPDIMEIFQGTDRYPESPVAMMAMASMSSGSAADENGLSNVCVSNGVLKVQYRRSTTQTAVSAQGTWVPSLMGSDWLYSGESSSGTVVTVTDTVVSNGLDFEVIESSCEVTSGSTNSLFFKLELSPNE